MHWLLAITYLPVLLLLVLIAFYSERKLASFIQDRYGPMETGPYGLFQAFADIVKLFQKEDIRPFKADRILFNLAPLIVFFAIYLGFALIPFGPSIMPAFDSALFFVLAIVSLDVLGLLAAGWSSNNKYALFGAFRSVAQMVSYEIPLGLSILIVLVFTQSLDLVDIVHQQGVSQNEFLGFNAKWLTDFAGFLSWNIFRNPMLFIAFPIFFIASLAECNRAPFDIPEAESELVAGYHAEYSGFRFSLFFLSEYAMMWLIAILGSILFFGGWLSPLPNLWNVKLFDWTSGYSIFVQLLSGGFWLFIKSFTWVLSMIWIRWTLPRFRIDQLLTLCWKYLTPIAIITFLLAAYWKVFLG